MNKKAKVGMAVIGLDNTDTLSFYGSEQMPIQSVYKFHLALAVLNLVERGKLSLSQKVFIPKSQLRPNTWIPLRDKYPDGDVSLTLDEILKFTVSQSDNIGCDLLFNLIGGTSVVNDYIHSIGIEGVSIAATEEQMAQGWDVQFTNWTTPRAAVQLLQKFQNKEIIPTLHDYLYKIMTETSTGPKRLKGLLPEGTVVAHKTGTSDTNKEGITAAINDIGIVVLPNGKYYFIAVFVTNSYESFESNESIIAEISKLVYDEYEFKSR